jgi:hypothetical protein
MAEAIRQDLIGVQSSESVKSKGIWKASVEKDDFMSLQ